MVVGKWSVDELSKLKELYQSYTKQEIARVLNRSVFSVVGALNTFKIRKRNKSKVSINCTEVELAYIAGIIDGEGNIQIVKIKPGKKYGSINYTYELKVSVSNTDWRLVDWLRNKVGGFISTCKSEGKKNAYKIGFSISIVDRLLPLVYNYMIIKKEQVDVAFEFRKTFDTKHPRRKSTNSEVLSVRESLYRKMLDLHNSGRIRNETENQLCE